MFKKLCKGLLALILWIPRKTWRGVVRVWNRLRSFIREFSFKRMLLVLQDEDFVVKVKYYVSRLALFYLPIWLIWEFKYVPVGKYFFFNNIWIALLYLSLFLFAYSKMTGLLAALSVAWMAVAIGMGTPYNKALVVLFGLGLVYLVEPLFRKKDAGDINKLPTTKTDPISEKEFFTFATEGENKGHFFIGENVEKRNEPVWIPEYLLTEHLQVCGITRCGKTQGLMQLAYQAMIRGWSVIQISGKPSRTDWNTFWYLADKAERTKDVYYFDPTDPETDTFNPIHPVRAQGSESETANQIMRAIGREPPASQEKSDAFYKGADFSRVLDLAEMFVGVDKIFTLKDCYAFFSDNLCREYLYKKLEKVACESSDKEVKKKVELVISRTKEMFESITKKKYDALEGIVSQLRPWVASPLSDAVNPIVPDFTIPKIFEERKLLYAVLSPGSLHAQANSLGRQLIAQVFATSEMLGQKGGELNPCLLVLDEFQEYLPAFFGSVISQAGGRNVCIVLAHQDFSQLRRIEGVDPIAFSENIINNTSTKLFYSTRSADDADKMSAIFGTKNIIQKSQSTTVQVLGDTVLSGIHERQIEEPLIHPNWFRKPKKFLAACSNPEGHEIIRTTLFRSAVSSQVPSRVKVTPHIDPSKALRLDAIDREEMKLYLAAKRRKEDEKKTKDFNEKANDRYQKNKEEAPEKTAEHSNEHPTASPNPTEKTGAPSGQVTPGQEKNRDQHPNHNQSHGSSGQGSGWKGKYIPPEKFKKDNKKHGFNPNHSKSPQQQNQQSPRQSVPQNAGEGTKVNPPSPSPSAPDSSGNGERKDSSLPATTPVATNPLAASENPGSSGVESSSPAVPVPATPPAEVKPVETAPTPDPVVVDTSSKEGASKILLE